MCRRTDQWTRAATACLLSKLSVSPPRHLNRSVATGFSFEKEEIMKKLTTGVLLLLLIQCVWGQTRNAKPDLSGTWRLVESHNIRRSQPGTFEKTLLISHREPEIRITIQLNENGRERNLEQVYFSDKRGEANPAFGNNQSINTKTRWNGKRLEIRRIETTTLRDPAGTMRTIRIEIREIWELSEDRNRLTHTTSVSSPGGKVVNEASVDNSPPVEVFARVEQ